MGARGPKPQGLRALSLKIPEQHWAVYKAEADRLGMAWSHYVCSVLAAAHGLEPVGALRSIEPQLPLPLDGKGAA